MTATPPSPPVDTFDLEQPNNFDMMPTALWRYGAVSAAAAVTYVALRRFFTMRKGQAIPSRRELAHDLGVSVRSVDSRLDELIAAGWLLITPQARKDGQGQSSNHYMLLWDPIDSADDPRLVEHQRRVEEFEAWITSRYEANLAAGKTVPKERERSVRSATWDRDVASKRQVKPPRRKLHGEVSDGSTPVQDPARGPRAESCTGRAQEVARGPVQEVAPLEPNPLEPNPDEPETDSSLRSESAAEDAQTTIDGEPSKPKPRTRKTAKPKDPEDQDRMSLANTIAQQWITGWEKERNNGQKLVDQSRKLFAVRGLVKAALDAGRTEAQVRNALRAYWQDSGRGGSPVPSAVQWSRLMDNGGVVVDIRGGYPGRTAAAPTWAQGAQIETGAIRFAGDQPEPAAAATGGWA